MTFQPNILLLGVIFQTNPLKKISRSHRRERRNAAGERRERCVYVVEKQQFVTKPHWYLYN
jgi:hypothetical protein